MRPADVTTEKPLYPYSSPAAPADRMRYAYSSFSGESFVAAWRTDRTNALKRLPVAVLPPVPALAEQISSPGVIRAHDAVEFIWSGLCGAHVCDDLTKAFLEKLLQRFEISLKLHEHYDENHRPVNREAFADVATHLRLGEIFAECSRRQNDLRFLSALLKLIDTLIPKIGKMTDYESARLSNLITLEIESVDALIEYRQKNGTAHVDRQIFSSGARVLESGAAAPLDGVVLLAARTARSQAYVQAIARARMVPDKVIIYGARSRGMLGQYDLPSNRTAGVSIIEDIFTPDLSESIDQTAQRAGWQTTRIDDDDVNSPSLLRCLRHHNPRLTVFSGFGGQIVGAEMLAISPFVHAHSGRLPDYRGSTTLYYSWLAENTCSVTTFLLSDQLDQGRILRCKDYSPPPSGLDVDYLYDNAVRADCLVETLAEYSRKGGLITSEPESQNKDTGHLFFIIHPLLKHIARASL